MKIRIKHKRLYPTDREFLKEFLRKKEMPHLQPKNCGGKTIVEIFDNGKRIAKGTSSCFTGGEIEEKGKVKIASPDTYNKNRGILISLWRILQSTKEREDISALIRGQRIRDIEKIFKEDFNPKKF